MDRESKIIHGEMEQTRSSLGEKLETLERKVTGTVQDATEVVQDATAAVANTVETVQDAVQQTVATVKETVQDAVGSVKEAFNLSHQVDRHPWLMVGGAVAAGYLGQRFLMGGGGSPKSAKSLMAVSAKSMPNNGNALQDHANGEHANGEHDVLGKAAAAPEPAVDEGPGGFLHAELGKLKKLAIGATLGLARNMVTQSLTKEISEPLANILNSITSKLGGECQPAAGQDDMPRGDEREDEAHDVVATMHGNAPRRAGVI